MNHAHHDPRHHATREHGPLQVAAWLLIALGTILVLAMSFGLLRHDLAMFLATSAFVVSGLLWGFAGAPRRIGGLRRDDGPAVSPRDDR